MKLLVALALIAYIACKYTSMKMIQQPTQAQFMCRDTRNLVEIIIKLPVVSSCIKAVKLRLCHLTELKVDHVIDSITVAFVLTFLQGEA